mmetsp:Transcript_17851/g.38247  ORF Transcript_17851/g.38247 Transcript_17851/m.38247 type:complete len:398 (-) Transcript_17851:392-1585(-)|eukprot:CAMPEP_0206421802 /NCGR_PEP_ID=MMETSP0324_2-20121206/1669_1 /ASSEMBLY_ACC=CAM_ASM_000836 /TAXON_ID=2866 /ORGANISM="Crypthecodinium cohnii, Strain Seligo" /LENGTH=397 /DNA_ID=CAMNT_0053885975 /DNA_START=136 /DNA_END=1329 /DNA_ORIENTATION=-
MGVEMGLPDDLHMWLRGQLEVTTVNGALAIALSSMFLAIMLRTKLNQPSEPPKKGSNGSRSGEVLAQSNSPTSRGTVRLGNERVAPCLQGTIFPSTGLLSSNPEEPYEFENDNCSGLFLPLHRPTHNPALDKSCQYPFGDHFKGRKRLWELRLQVRFKQRVDKSLLIGIELEDYVPLNNASQKLMALTVAALRRVAGNDLYHSVGDDPSKGSGPHEKPVFMMPLWACDQIIVTPEGEDPPLLTDPMFCNYGDLRTNDRKAFINTATNLELVPGPTYTFSFWGISQFLDVIKWEVQKVVPFKSIDFNVFCGRPPVQIVFYTLDDEVIPGDTRHLQSRKKYYFRFALWSSEKRPSANVLKELLPSDNGFTAKLDEEAIDRSRHSTLTKVFACCTGSRSA